MPVDWRYVDEYAGVIVTGFGVMTGDEVAGFTRAHYASKEKKAKYRWGLLDYSDVENVLIDFEEMNRISELTLAAAKTIREGVVVLVARTDLVFGLCRQWELLVDSVGWACNVVRSRAEAEIWLRKTVKEKFNIDVTLE